MTKPSRTAGNEKEISKKNFENEIQKCSGTLITEQ